MPGMRTSMRTSITRYAFSIKVSPFSVIILVRSKLACGGGFAAGFARTSIHLACGNLRSAIPPALGPRSSESVCVHRVYDAVHLGFKYNI